MEFIMPCSGTFRRMKDKQTLFRVLLLFVVVVGSCKVSLAKRIVVKDHEMDKSWKRCCEYRSSICRQNSCYWLSRRTKSWSSARNYCRSRYPDWPNFADLVQLRAETDVSDVVLPLLSKLYDYRRYRERNITAWTSGLGCPTAFNDGSVQSRWTTNETFSKWLLDKIDFKSLGKSSKTPPECFALAVTQDKKKTDLIYEFKNREKEYASICQFRHYEEIDYKPTTERQTTTLPPTSSSETTSSTASTTRTTSLKPTTTSPKPTTTSLKSTTMSTFLMITSSTMAKSSSSTPKIRTTPSTTIKTTTARTTTTLTPTVTKPQQAKLTRLTGLYCKERQSEGMNFPVTPPGVTVTVSCPKGMEGHAYWKCDPKTGKFFPDRPYTHFCRHQWIADLEEEVSTGKDAVSISQKLANSTQHTNLAHGDISAIVNVTEKLLILYSKQRIKELDKLDELQKNSCMSSSYDFTHSVAVTYSHLLRLDVKNAWSHLDYQYQQREASKILRHMTTAGHQLSCSKAPNITDDDDLQFTVKEENIQLQTFLIDTEGRPPGPYFFPKEKDEWQQNRLTFPDNLNFSMWPSKANCGAQKTAVGVIYKHIGQFLKEDDSVEMSGSNSTSMVVTPILSFSLSVDDVHSVKLPSGLSVDIELSHSVPLEQFESQRFTVRCVFWNFAKEGYGKWDTDGCTWNYTNKTHTLCSCDHLTNFAVLFDFKGIIDNEDPNLEFLTNFCCGLSVVALFVTCICLIVIKSFHGRRSIITWNLSLCLLITNLLVLFGLEKTEDYDLCFSVAILLHYFLLAAFCWMVLQGFHLYQMVVLVFSRSLHISMRYFYAFGYGAPMIIVGTCVSLRYQDYLAKNVCWLSYEQGLVWSFVGPACGMLIGNFGIFFLTLKSASTLRIRKEMSTKANIKAWMKGSFSVMCLLGLTWVVGLFYLVNPTIFSYIFILCNGLQGVFIFVFHILLNEKAIEFFLKAFHKKLKPKVKVRTLTQTTDSRPSGNRSNTTLTTGSGNSILISSRL